MTTAKYPLNRPFDVGAGFDEPSDTYFFASSVVSYDPGTHQGQMQWQRYLRKPRLSFNQIDYPFAASQGWEFPDEYADQPVTDFQLAFLSERTIRLRMKTRPVSSRKASNEPSLMLEEGAADRRQPWESRREGDSAVVYESPFGSVTVGFNPWKITLRNSQGDILTETRHLSDSKSLLNSNQLPFAFRRSSADMGNQLAASFSLQPGEKLFGTGESFTRLNKRGQRIDLFTTDALSAQTPRMYKPIPFYLSSQGYGMFVHSTAPMTFDLGAAYDDTQTLYTGEEELDLFLFIGEPKDVLTEYTNLTGKSPLPPLWSFGLWMSRITYSSEEEVREVAEKLRTNGIPADVIHLDTGWFDKDWRCNYEFSGERFENPARMIADLKEQGLRVSLWQLPYFTPTNPLYGELLEKGYAVWTGEGNLPTDDAILDFSNPDAEQWYKEKIAGLLELGVGAIKVDFGEAAPLNGLYASGRSGYAEHNLYPLRYNRAVADITREVNGEAIIWARSAWAGSQRYPIHWGGDAENTDSAMAASLRGGLSLGLSGFTFWSHDIGGFVESSLEALYRRWLPFGMLTSHSRCHGAPPTEPWAYGEDFTAYFRRVTELKYSLLPYIYTQAKLSADKGHPLLRALFFEFPNDPGSWLVEDQYMFGTDLLIAPIFEEKTGRNVYLPPGEWIDFQTGARWTGCSWQRIEAGDIPIILLVKAGSVIPQLKPALSTTFLDWENIAFHAFEGSDVSDQGPLCCSLFEPSGQKLYAVEVKGSAVTVKSSDTREADNTKPGWTVLTV
ncbi:alpha-xylosidase [Paenibacillus sp. NPDC058174]|uniref:glycoside hydrolase family 31 protein n=1 Tax=Paenibacillus sp. NPDC058174 TaxID=3346366 RepID=UPI0036D7E260